MWLLLKLHNPAQSTHLTCNRIIPNEGPSTKGLSGTPKSCQGHHKISQVGDTAGTQGNIGNEWNPGGFCKGRMMSHKN